MPSSRLLAVGSLACLAACLCAGCGSFARRRAQTDLDYEAWLFRRGAAGSQVAADGRPAPGPAGPAADSAVQPAGASAPPAAGDPNVQRLGTSIADADKSKPADDDPEGGIDWSAKLDPTRWYKKAKAAAGYGPDEKLSNTLYAEGMDFYRDKKYADAAKKFGQAADRWPDSTLEEDALFYKGECFFQDDQYGRAHDTFRVLCKKFDNSRYLDTIAQRQFAIGRYWEQKYRADPHWPVTPNFSDKTLPWFDAHGNAMNAYLAVRLNDPTGPLADDAVMAMGNAYFQDQRYEDAAQQYDTIRKEYPKSEFQKDAHLLSLQSKLRSYQGPYYESKPLEAADQVARQTVQQFRGQLGEEQGRVLHTVDEIRNEKARRQFALAQFYETKRAYGAARLCYQSLLKDYPDTPLATQAEQRFEVIKNFPAQPINHFKWLTDFFDLLREDR